MAVYPDYVAIFGGMKPQQVRDYMRNLAHGNAACKSAIEYAIRKVSRESRRLWAFRDMVQDPAMLAWTIGGFANAHLAKIGSSHYINVITE